MFGLIYSIALFFWNFLYHYGQYLAVVWFITITSFLYYIVFVKLKYTETLDPNIREEHKPFQRTDRKNWSFIKMVIVGYFLLIPRIIFSINTIVCATLIQKMLGVIEKNNHNKEYGHIRRELGTFFGQISAQLILFSFGFYSIKRVKKDIKEFDPEYKEPKEIKHFQKMGPITISNHISWCDVMVLISSRYCPSFLSKKAVQSYPLYGSCTTALQSIYLDRENIDNKNEALDLIKQRCEYIKQGRNFPALHIYPEGTTSNGKYLISFKKGAFEPKMPMDIICLKYEDRDFHPAIDIGQLYTIILQLCQWKNCCTMYELGTFYPEGNIQFQNNENDWMLYAKRVKGIMLRCLNVKNSEAGFRNLKEYQQIQDHIALKKRQLKAKSLQKAI